MNTVERHLLKIGVDHYDEALARGQRFTVTDVGDSLADDLLDRFADDRSVTRDLIAITAHQLARKIDRDRTKPEAGASLLDDLDRPIPVSDAQRIVRRRMGMADWAAHLAHVGANAARVNASAARENSRFAALAPYLTGNATTESAVAAWQVDHPGDVLP